MSQGQLNFNYLGKPTGNKDRIADFGAEFDFFQDANDLAFTELRFLHVETPFLGILYFRLAQVFEETSKRIFWNGTKLKVIACREVPQEEEFFQKYGSRLLSFHSLET